MARALKECGKYPIMILFFLFLAVFTLGDMISPAKETSVLENRALAQSPPFNWNTFINNEWTKQYDEYTKDQLWGRDEWITLQSLLESAQGKLENGGVWYAHNGYQIAKNAVWSQAQQNTLPINTQAVCELSQRYPGRVSAVIAPSPANILSDLLPWNPPQYDENTLLDTTFTSMRNSGVNVIDLRGEFTVAHRDGQQLYYRTDHHWTTDGGAFIAYRLFCESTGLEPRQPLPGLQVEVPAFLGTNYAKTKRFGTRPDTLLYYDFPQQLAVYNMNNDGSTSETLGPIMDDSKLDGYDKYGAFLRGNNGYSVLEGEGEGSILVLKDSYGNSFIPYLIQNYAKIGIIDLRLWPSVDSTVQEGGYDNILVLYSFDIFSQDAAVKRMMTSMQQ